jgi:hypothetical protein
VMVVAQGTVQGQARLAPNPRSGLVQLAPAWTAPGDSNTNAATPQAAWSRSALGNHDAISRNPLQSMSSPGERGKHSSFHQPAAPPNVGCPVGADERCWQHDQHAHESPPGCSRMFSQRPTPHLPPPTRTTTARRPGRRLSTPCRRNSETGRARHHARTACPPSSLATRGDTRRLNPSAPTEDMLVRGYCGCCVSPGR